MSAALEARGVSKWYDLVVGVHDVSFALQPGVTGLLGPNGAGKSTLLKLLAGQLEPSRGELLISGHSAWNNPDVFRELGLCPEQDAFYESMTGLAFVAMLAELSGFPRSEALARAEGALAVTGMSANLHKRIAGMSRGMRQRVKLAQAIVHEPPILLLDEPMTGLDPVGRKEMNDLIRGFAKEGRTVLVSSHILPEVEAVSDRILLMNHGRLLAEGEITEVREAIDTQPIKIYLHTPDPRAAARLILEMPETLSVAVDDEARSVVAETKQAGPFYRGLMDLMIDKGLEVDTLYTRDEDLQAVFSYLTA